MSKIYVVATPIGNLKDITLRALEVLKSVDFVASEDTRVTTKLLNHYEIKKLLISIHEHSKPEKIKKILEDLKKENKSMAFTTDAGTPGISDPGGLLIFEALKLKIEVIPIPGPSSVTAALSISGFPISDFLFLGYFPKKKGRETLLKKLRIETRPIIFFESPYRVLKTLKGLEEFLGLNRELVVCRELTKKFETIYRGKISEILPKIKPKGEFTVIIKGQNAKK